MKASELMVGDLVLHDGKVIRVDAVHKRKIGYHKTKDKLTWLFSGQFEPIPLTKELLEKNGFVEIELVLVGGCKKKSIVREGIDVAIDFVQQEFWIVHVGKLFYETHMLIDYLHELQHLLTLCKIDFDWKV